ncbi:dihydrofolate reductase family protein [Phormidesmis priestleyi]
MRKLKLQVQLSIDGFISGSNGEMDWMTLSWDDDLKQYVSEITDPVDCIVLGRKLAEGFIPHWAARPEGADARSIDKFNDTEKSYSQQRWSNPSGRTRSWLKVISRRKSQS